MMNNYILIILHFLFLEIVMKITYQFYIIIHIILNENLVLTFIIHIIDI